MSGLDEDDDPVARGLEDETDNKSPPRSADANDRSVAADVKSPPPAGGGGGGGGGGGSGAAVKSPARSAVTGQAINYDLITLKVAVIGPKQSGKTVIANHLSGFGADTPQPENTERYDPTVGVRILEFEREITGRSRDGKQSTEAKVLVELWDCSGDPKYEAGWPAITKDLLGVCIVFDPKSKSQTAEIKAWCEWFAKNADLDSPQCVLFAHSNLNTQHPNFGPIKTGKKTVSIPVVNVNTASPVGSDGSKKPSSVQLAFRHFLGDAYGFHRLADH